MHAENLLHLVILQSEFVISGALVIIFKYLYSLVTRWGFLFQSNLENLDLSYKIDIDFYAPNFGEVEGAYWFGPVRPSVHPSVCP